MLRILLGVLAGICMVCVAVWGALAIYYRAPIGEGTKQMLGGALGLLAVAAIVGLPVKRLRPATVAFGIAFLALLGWWSTIEPSNDRDWQPEVAVLAWAEVNGDLVTIHNIRNFEYRSETDFTPHYYDKTFDLRKLDTADLVGSYWMGDAIAHMMVSFGFSGEDYLAVSIETRKERTESYSTVAGFFREYELYYVVADERDVIGVRAVYRKDPPEDVYIFRTNAPKENVRRLFLSYIDQINSLKQHAQFYNTLTTNCTTNIWMHTKVNPNPHVFNWKILASGYTPLMVYEWGRLDTRLPFEELRRRSHINEAARAAINAPDFSQRIRAGVPAPPRS
jgi:hypothetical protein